MLITLLVTNFTGKISNYVHSKQPAKEETLA